MWEKNKHIYYSTPLQSRYENANIVSCGLVPMRTLHIVKYLWIFAQENFCDLSYDLLVII